MKAFLVAAAFFFGACRPPQTPKRAAVPSATPTWTTLRAEHRVTIDVELDGGKHDRRSIRGVVAVSRPDRFRLRALGPGGITLFDLVDVAGQVRVVESLRDPKAPSLRPILEAMAGDLSASFLLTPVPEGRVVSADRDGVTVDEPERKVRLSAFVSIGAHSVPTHVHIDHKLRHYHVDVDARDVELDVALDPALFSD